MAADTEQTTTTAADPPGGPKGKGKGKPKTIGGIPAPVAIAGIVAFGLAAVYFLMHRSSSAASSAGAGDQTAGGANSPADDSAALADIEQQLADLNGMIGQGGGGGSDGGGGTVGTTGDGGGGTGTGTGTGTGGPPAKNPVDKLHYIEAGGKGATRTLWQIAHDNGISEAQLLRLNPQLKKYEGSKKPIPKRQRILV